MTRHFELELYERAKELFERENPGKLWRLPYGVYSVAGQNPCDVLERQNYLLRVRDQMIAEGEVLPVRENSSVTT